MGSIIFLVLGIVATIAFFVYVGLKSRPMQYQPIDSIFPLSQSGNSLLHIRHNQHVDHVGLYLHEPNEPHNRAHPHDQKVIISP